MDFIDVFLLFVVSVSVTIFLILQNLEEKTRKTRQEVEKSNIYVDSERFLADQDVENTVGAEFPEKGCECVEERSGVLGISGNTGVIEDDWEGIERTDLEKLFGKAVVFVNSENNAARFDGGILLKLYGLQKVALEGPCHDSQPMALKVSARSKWNAWQKLGNMRRETAMEEYIEILTTVIPEWKGKVSEVMQDAGSLEAQTSSSYKDGADNDMLSERDPDVVAST